MSYKSFWASTLLVVLRNFPASSISVMDLAKMTSIVTEDIVATLQHLGLLQTVNSNHVICAPPDVIENLMQKYPIKVRNFNQLFILEYRVFKKKVVLIHFVFLGIASRLGKVALGST